MAVNWFEIYVQDMDRATDFYQHVFNATMEDVLDVPDESHTRIIQMGERSVGAQGALVKSDHIGPNRGGTIVYFDVDDCAVEEERVRSGGGTIIESKKAIGPHGFMSLCEDTEGNLFGLYSAT
jgi:uncharacterized protein